MNTGFQGCLMGLGAIGCRSDWYPLALFWAYFKGKYLIINYLALIDKVKRQISLNTG